MAKQTSLIKINGKADGQSFYTSKNGGALMRSINQGMSQRVKDGKEYLNTRKNNAEFGMCGDFAGAIIKPLSLRWRFILDSIATGKMVKKMKELIVMNTTEAWGQRVLTADHYLSLVEAFNSFSKNEMIEEIANILAQPISWTDDDNVVTLGGMPQLTVARQQELIAEGVNYFYTKVFALQVVTPTFDTNANAYTKATSTLVEIPAMSNDAQLEASAAIDLVTDRNGVADFTEVVVNGEFGGLLVVFLPARKVGNSISILQEKCSAMLAPVVAG